MLGKMVKKTVLVFMAIMKMIMVYTKAMIIVYITSIMLFIKNLMMLMMMMVILTTTTTTTTTTSISLFVLHALLFYN